ncbi:peroxisome assembly per8 [Pyrrhoderma noxium]|uniref:RING-type E3 ubiquitin transferase n=1 Tax=Pyrrhoderma noxium TaxID=2282107 RepID=A0A286URJ4_9AGAM|nr:peroxisome assembly per8 [Pyrrhoderma noxium]
MRDPESFSPFISPAQQPQIIRANQRDLLYVYSLREQAENVFRSWLGNRWLSRWDKELELCSKLLYYGLTTGQGHQTLGEEYTNIWDFSTSERGLPSARRRAALVFLPALPAYLISRFQSSLSGGNERVARILRLMPTFFDILSEINLAAFYFSGVYYNLVRRVLRVKHLSSIPENPNSRPPSYSLLGILIAFRLIHRLFSAIRDWRRSWTKESNTLETSSKGKQVLRNEKSSEASIDGIPISEIFENAPNDSTPPVPAEEDENTILDFERTPGDVGGEKRLNVPCADKH